MICFSSVVLVYKVILRLDHLLSLNFLSLQALSFSKLRSMAAVSSSRRLRKILNRTRSSSLWCAISEGYPLGVWNPQGRVSCHRWEYFAKETEWRKEHGELLFLSWCTDLLTEMAWLQSLRLKIQGAFWSLRFLTHTIYHPNQKIFVWGRCYMAQGAETSGVKRDYLRVTRTYGHPCVALYYPRMLLLPTFQHPINKAS